jgi:hypothetical protein
MSTDVPLRLSVAIGVHLWFSVSDGHAEDSALLE